MNDITNGRKRGCNACGESQSFESLEFAGILPYDSLIIMLPIEMHGKGNDISEVLQLDNILVLAS